MTPEAVLLEVFARLAARRGEPLFIREQEVSEWPVDAVTALRSHQILQRSRPATNVVCTGCERACVMPVHVRAEGNGVSRAFVVCDRRPDINRVAVPDEALKQQRVSCEPIAVALAVLLSVPRQASPVIGRERWEIGVCKGRERSSHIVLLADRELNLKIGGHLLPLAEVLKIKRDRLTVDKRTLFRAIDNPIAGAGDVESASQRRDRVERRIREEKAKGTRGFLKAVAEEEGVSVSRIKQIQNHK